MTNTFQITALQQEQSHSSRICTMRILSLSIITTATFGSSRGRTHGLSSPLDLAEDRLLADQSIAPRRRSLPLTLRGTSCISHSTVVEDNIYRTKADAFGLGGDAHNQGRSRLRQRPGKAGHSNILSVGTIACPFFACVFAQGPISSSSDCSCKISPSPVKVNCMHILSRAPR